MKHSAYLITQNNSFLYTFISRGKKGEILKGIIFETTDEIFYNLVLVDYDFESKKWSDKAISNNGDMVKIMATVSQAIYHFLNEKPNCVIQFKGNTAAKQKLYNRVVCNNLDEWNTEFNILGEINNEQEFAVIDKSYESFYIYKK